MTQSETEARANRHGSTCPPWCGSAHDREIVPGVWNDSHISDPVATPTPFGPTVRLVGGGRSVIDSRREVMVQHRAACLTIEMRDAEDLAGLLEQLSRATAGQMMLLADAVRAAAGIAEGEGR